MKNFIIIILLTAGILYSILFAISYVQKLSESASREYSKILGAINSGL